MKLKVIKVSPSHDGNGDEIAGQFRVSLKIKTGPILTPVSLEVDEEYQVGDFIDLQGKFRLENKQYRDSEGIMVSYNTLTPVI